MESIPAISELFDGNYTGVIPKKKELYKLLDNFPCQLETDNWAQLRSHLRDGDAAADAMEWPIAAEHYEQCIAVVKDFVQFLPDELQVRVCLWARCNLVPIYHFELKRWKKCIDTIDEILQDVLSDPDLSGYLGWHRRAAYLEWAYDFRTWRKDGERDENLALIETALEAPPGLNPNRFGFEAFCTLCYKFLSGVYVHRGRLDEAQKWIARAESLLAREYEVVGVGLRFHCKFQVELAKAGLLHALGKFEECGKLAQKLEQDLLQPEGEEYLLNEYVNPGLDTKRSMLHLSLRLYQSGDGDKLVGLFEPEQPEIRHPQHNEHFRYAFQKMNQAVLVRLEANLKENASKRYGMLKAALQSLEETYEFIHGDPTLAGCMDMCLVGLEGCHNCLYSVDGDAKHLEAKERYLKEALALEDHSLDIKAQLNFSMGETLHLLQRDGGQTDRAGAGQRGYDYYKEAAALYSQKLFGLKRNVGYSIFNKINGWGEDQVFWRLQQTLYFKLCNWDLLSGTVGFKSSIPANKEQVQQALVWAERGRTRALMYQLRSLSQEAKDDLLKFDLNDEFAWNSIMDSLSVCGGGTRFVEYSYDAGRFLVYVVKEDGEVCVRFSAINCEEDPEKLEKSLKKIYWAMADEETYSNEKGLIMDYLEELYEFFIHPIADLLEDMHTEDKLVFIGNGFARAWQLLNTVPFTILRDPRSKRYLFQRHTIALSPSIRVLKHCSCRLEALKKLPLILGTPGAGVVVGDPAYQILARLKGTRDEVDRIAQLFGSNTVQNLQGTDANIPSVLYWAKLPLDRKCSQGFLHFAVHGQGGEESWLEPDKELPEKFKNGVLELAHPLAPTWPPISESQATSSGTKDSESMEDEARASNYQVVHSTQITLETAEIKKESFGEVGGVLRGRRVSKQSLKQGKLTSEDIINSGFIWQCRMVVLSACETYRGKVFPEGVLNLPRAFMAVGIPCAVVSLWPVKDSSAPDFMYSFYANLRRGCDAATALRSVMLDMHKKDVEVYKWGPMVVCGLPNVKLPRELLLEENMQAQNKMD